MSKPPKEWMLPLKTLGFAKKGPVFARTANDVDQTIFTKKNLHDRTFQIWATVGIRDPYESKEYEQQYVFWSYVYPKALHFYSVQESWWPEKELPNSIDAIISYAIPWLDSHFTLQELLFDVEHCIITPQSWQDYFEKRQNPSRPWNAIYYHASLLHMKLGNKEASCKRAHEWLHFVRGSKDNEPGRTIRQMQDLGCEQNAQIVSLLAQPVPPPEQVVARKVDEECFRRLKGETKKE